MNVYKVTFKYFDRVWAQSVKAKDEADAILLAKEKQGDFEVINIENVRKLSDAEMADLMTGVLTIKESKTVGAMPISQVSAKLTGVVDRESVLKIRSSK